MRVAGIDYGTVRIGVATADTEVGIAGPYENYTRRSEKLDADYFFRLATEERIARFVVGLPVHTSGHESQKSREAREFGQWLNEITGVPVEFFDERYTSAEAEALLLDAGLTKKRRRERLDQLAAQIVLTAYLESGAGRMSQKHWSSSLPAISHVPTSPTRILFGCGYLGHRVAKLWRRLDHHTIAFTRRGDPTREMIEALVFTGQADVTKPETLHCLSELLALGGIPVESLLYAVGYDRSAGADIQMVYAGGLRNVLAALPVSVTRAIYISTTGVYGSAGGGWVDEETPPNPQREGGKASLAAEQVLVAHAVGRHSAILRLGGLYGPGRVPYLDQLRAGAPVPVPSAGWLNLIHVDDAAAIVVAVDQWLGHRKLADGPHVFCVTDGLPVQRRDYYAEVARLIGAPSPQFSDPPADSPAAARAASDRRIRNGKLCRTLPVRLAYPSYRKGLASILATDA